MKKYEEGLPIQIDITEGESGTSEDESNSNKVVKKLRDDLYSYISEYSFWHISKHQKLQTETVDELIGSNDVVLFGKVGCGYCERAKEALINHNNSSDTKFKIKVYNVFGNHEISLNEARSMAKVLRYKLGIFDLTFPQIVVKGYYVGGSNNIIDFIEKKEFEGILQNSHAALLKSGKVTWYPSLKSDAVNPKLLKVPTMKNSWYPHWPWYTFQWVMYLNMLRYISILHIIFMTSSLFLLQAEYYLAANVILWFLTCDLTMFIIFGPAPFSLIGSVCYYFLWKIRGNVTSTIPYKVVFSFYIGSFLSYLMKESKEPTDSVLILPIFNSVLLAVFRF